MGWEDALMAILGYWPVLTRTVPLDLPVILESGVLIDCFLQKKSQHLLSHSEGRSAVDPSLSLKFRLVQQEFFVQTVF